MIINISYQGQVMELLRSGISILINVKLSYKVIGVVLHQYVYPIIINISYQGHVIILLRSGISM